MGAGEGKIRTPAGWDIEQTPLFGGAMWLKASLRKGQGWGRHNKKVILPL